MSSLIIVLSLFLLMPAQLFSQKGPDRLDGRQIQLLTENITHNLSLDSDEIKANTLQLLIDLDATHPEVPLDFAVIPVMRILKRHADEGMRILSAVTLQHIGGERARFAVRRRAAYDASDRVARHCARLARFWDMDVMALDALAQTAVRPAADSPVPGSPDLE